MCAVAMTPVMIAGHIDVSIAGTVVLGGVVAGLLINDGVPVWLAFGMAVLVGGGVGLINSWLVLGLGITSMIATIGMLYVTQGVANILTNGLPIGGLPPSFLYVGQGSIDGVPVAAPMICSWSGSLPRLCRSLSSAVGLWRPEAIRVLRI